MKLEFSGQIFRNKVPVSNSLKIRSVGAELFHADGQTDGHEPNGHFWQFREGALEYTTRYFP